MSSLDPSWWRLALRSVLRSLDVPLLSALLLMMGLGLITMYSAGGAYDSLFLDDVRNMLLALVVLTVVAQIPPQRLLSIAVPLYSFGVALLIAVAVFGITKKGATRWLNVGVVIQPSEVMKIAMPLMMAWWFQRREGQLRKLDWVIAGCILFLPVLLVMKQPDLGTALLILMAGASVIFFAGVRWMFVIPPFLLALVGIVALVVFEPSLCAQGVDWPLLHGYQQQRVCTLLDPMRDPLGAGFHVIQGMVAIGSGGVTGAGFMQGTQTHLSFLPEKTTDFIFAAFSEEFGLIGNVLLIGCYCFLIFRGLTIALRAPTLFSRLLAGSLSIMFFSYAFVNMGMVSGILPVVGVPLPFLSYGGTAMVTLGFALGIIMAISKSKQLMQS